MGKGSLSDGRVMEAAKKTVTVYADATDRSNPSPAYMMYGVRSIPCVVFADDTGKKLDAISGREMILVDNFVKKINSVIKKYERSKRKYAGIR